MPPGTMVCFHAHPDDEVITTGGTIARATAEGHRVVLVFATRGELGLVPEDLGAETLGDRRTREAREAADLLGVQQVEYLEYQDSGMAAVEQRQHLVVPGAEDHLGLKRKRTAG